jgi:hypothetical protein
VPPAITPAADRGLRRPVAKHGSLRRQRDTAALALASAALEIEPEAPSGSVSRTVTSCPSRASIMATRRTTTPPPHTTTDPSRSLPRR